MPPQAWDGSGHFAVSKIFSETIFPDVFGWSPAFFTGMPLPNYYPPLLYWLVALLSRIPGVGFAAAFAVGIGLGPALLPASLFFFAWRSSKGDWLFAAATGLSGTPLLVDARMASVSLPSGLDYFSVFQIGLYSQPLGTALLMVWAAFYSTSGRRPEGLFRISTLLALVALTNFFALSIACFVIAGTLVIDGAGGWWSDTPLEARQARRAFLFHFASPMVALALGLVWIGPAILDYAFVVTRPSPAPLSEAVSPAVLCWWGLALCSLPICLGKMRAGVQSWLLAAIFLAIWLLLAPVLVPGWFPLQDNRLLAHFNWMLCPPIGALLSASIRFLVRPVGVLCVKRKHGGITIPFLPDVAAWSLLLLVALNLGIWIEPRETKLAFYSPHEFSRLAPILEFAKVRRDGRYMVEFPARAFVAAAFDGRALSAFLGMQGNQALHVVFREASASSLFLNPQIGAVSADWDNFGISSLLAEDLDFVEQPLSRHLDRLKHSGVRYWLVISPWIKFELSRLGFSATHFGAWSVFDLGPAPELAQALSHRPALVVSGFSLKLRSDAELDFVRLVEEQFVCGCFDPLLARSPEERLDFLRVPDQFGALIVLSYRYADENRAFENLKKLAIDHPLILVRSSASLFRRIEESLDRFAGATIIEVPETLGEPMMNLVPQRRYNNSAIRQAWTSIQGHLERTGQDFPSVQVTARASIWMIELEASNSSPEVPVLIRSTYSPNWRARDGSSVYWAGPSMMLTSVDGSSTLTFLRGPHHRLFCLVSGLALLLAVGSGTFQKRRKLPAPELPTVGTPDSPTPFQTCSVYGASRLPRGRTDSPTTRRLGDPERRG